MARKYGSVDAARRRTATRKSTRKPGGGKSPTAKRKKVQRGAAKAAPRAASESYSANYTRRKSSRKPGGNAAAAKKRQTKRMTKAAGKTAPSYIKTKPKVKKPNEHKSRRPKPRIEHINRKPKPPKKSRNVAHGDGSAMSISGKFYQEGLRAAMDRGIKKAGAAASRRGPSKGRSKYRRG